MKHTIILFACLSIAGSTFAGKKAPMDTPQISCAGGTQVSRSITICAPASGTGLPAGFSLQWMTCEDYAAYGNQWFDSEDLRLSKASFSGNASASRYNLTPGECVTVNVGDFLFDNGASTNSTGNLTCGTCYVFRSFAHANSTLDRSAFTTDLNCSTLDCGGGEPHCTLTFSQWATLGPECPHGQDFLYRPAALSVETTAFPPSLTLGTVVYSDFQLACILGTPANGNGLIELAHQLIAAKLNAAKNGSLPPGVATCVADADALIGGLVIPPAGGGFLDPSGVSALTTCLKNFNEGAVGPGSCSPIDPGLDNLVAPLGQAPREETHAPSS